MSQPSVYEPITYYADQSQVSSPGRLGYLFDDLPTDLSALQKLLHDVMISNTYAHYEGVELPRVRTNEVYLRTVQSKLEHLLKLNPVPLSEARSPKDRLIGNSRDFSLMLVSILRHHNLPARLRCGFTVYPNPGKYETSWITESWNQPEQRWQKVDIFMKPSILSELTLSFDPLDLPETHFIPPNLAWQRINSINSDPKLYGSGRVRGRSVIKNTLIHDFLCLNRIEPLPFDNFKLANTKIAELHSQNISLLDRLSKTTTGESRDFLLLRTAFLMHASSFLPDYMLE
ncbi:MAG: transglutaminase domain-containing protein [Anaerolineaceae bacterium]